MPTVIIPPTDVSPNTGTGSEVLSNAPTLVNPIITGTIDVSGNITAADLILGTSGPSVKSTLSARAPRQGLVFDGSTSAVATVANVPAFGTSDFTVAAWVNKKDFAAAEVIFGGVTAGFELYVNSGDGKLRVIKIATAINGESTTAIQAGKWTLVTYTRSGGSAGTFYINGISAGTITEGSPDYSAAVSKIGSDQSGAYFNGTIAEPLVYNRALSASEVVALYEAGAPAGADYVNGGTTAPTGATFLNFQYDTFTGASATGFTAAETGGQNCVAYSNYTSGVYAVGTKIKVTFSATLTSGATPSVYLANLAGTPVATAATVVAGSNSQTFTLTTATTVAQHLQLVFSTSGNTSYAISSVVVQPLGLLLAPDAAQAGGGLTWYDTSGNAANISWTSGVSWNVPSSGTTGGNRLFTGVVDINNDLYIGAGSILSLSRNNPTYNTIKRDTTNGGILLTANSNTLFFKDNGRLIIGSPSVDGGQTLQVSGTGYISSTLTVGSGGTGNNNGTVIANGGSGSLGGPLFAAQINGTNVVRLGSETAILGSGTTTKGVLFVQSGAFDCYTNGTLALTLSGSDQSAKFAGQVYLNTSSPPAWDPLSFNVMVAGSNAFGGTNTGSNNLIVASNTYFNGSVFKYATTGYATAYRQLVGRHEFYVAVSGSANATTTLVPSLIIQNAGTLTLSQYGAGTLSTDASGNVTASSDARLKANLRTFARGLADVLKLVPKTYNWNETSGMDTASDYVGFVAQDVQTAIPEAVYEGKDANKTLTLNDRAILAALVNAVKELNAKLS